MPCGQVQIGDERAHQPGLADAGRQGEAERRELALEVRDGRELGLDRRQSALSRSAPFSSGTISRDAVEDLERLALRRAQAEAAGDGVDMADSSLVLRHRTADRSVRLRLRRRCSRWRQRRRRLGFGHRQVLDLQAVVVVAPLAAGRGRPWGSS